MKFSHKMIADQNPFVIADKGVLIPIRSIDKILTEDFERSTSIVIKHSDGQDIISGIRAIEALMLIKPSVLEGRRMQWAKQSWLVHNTIGHSYLALMSLIGFVLRRFHKGWAGKCIKHGIYVHDKTCPAPKQFL